MTQEEFAQIEHAISAALAAGDAAAMAEHYTEDAVLMPPFRPAIHGREAIRAHYAASLERISIEFTSEVEEVHTDGDWGWARASFTQTLRPKGASTSGATTRGKSLIILRRSEDGRWRYARDIFNGDEPPKMAGGCLGALLSPFRKLFGG